MELPAIPLNPQPLLYARSRASNLLKNIPFGSMAVFAGVFSSAYVIKYINSF